MNRKIARIMREANEAYPDKYIAHYFDTKTGESLGDDIEQFGGDTLALFIGREILSIYDDNASIRANRNQAADALDTAARQLTRVADALRRSNHAPKRINKRGELWP